MAERCMKHSAIFFELISEFTEKMDRKIFLFCNFALNQLHTYQ